MFIMYNVAGISIFPYLVNIQYTDPDDYETWFHQYDDIIDQIKEWASAQENLDVYQMNSFYAGISNKRRQLVNYYKTAMVFFIQTAGAGYLAYNEFFLNSTNENLRHCRLTIYT